MRKALKLFIAFFFLCNFITCSFIVGSKPESSDALETEESVEDVLAVDRPADEDPPHDEQVEDDVLQSEDVRGEDAATQDTVDEEFPVEELAEIVDAEEWSEYIDGPDFIDSLDFYEVDSDDSGCVIIHGYLFNADSDGWITDGYRSDWQQGAATSGPMVDHDGGGGLWGTNLSGNAQNCQDSWIESPAMDLSGYSGSPIRLVFWTWYRMRPCDFLGMHDNYSGGVIEVFNGSTWNYVVPEGGYDACATDCVIDCSDGSADQCGGYYCTLRGMIGFNAYNNNEEWRQMEVTLSSYATDGIKIRFHFASYDDYECAPMQTGWYIDEVRIMVGCS